MLLSMSILADHLKKYTPECYLVEDAMDIRGLRFLNDEQLTLLPGYAYISSVELFFTDRQLQGAYLVASGKSRILCRNCDYEELLNDLLGAFEYYLNWEQRLMDAATHHAPLQEMLDIASAVVKAPFFVSKEDGSVILADFFPPDWPLDSHWTYIREHKSIAPQTVCMPLFVGDDRLVDFGEESMLVKGLSGETYIGQYLMQDGERIAFLSICPPDASATMVLQQLSSVMAPYFVFAEEFSAPSARIRSAVSLLGALLMGEHTEDMALKRFCEKGPSAPWRLLILSNPVGDMAARRRGLLFYLQQQSDVCVPFYLEELYVLVSEHALTPFLEEFRSNPGCSELLIGASVSFSDLRTLPTRRQQAHFALEETRGGPGLYRCEDYAFNYMLRSLAGQALIAELLHPALEWLEQYDREKNMELLPTLQVYLKNERKLLETSAELNIHRNTLKYRLQRIGELTEIDFANDRERDYLALSCRLNLLYQKPFGIMIMLRSNNYASLHDYLNRNMSHRTEGIP